MGVQMRERESCKSEDMFGITSPYTAAIDSDDTVENLKGSPRIPSMMSPFIHP